MEEGLVKLLEDLKLYHQKKLLELGREFVPKLTPEDVLQPNDYIELEENPEFRYEEGVLAGVLEVQSALQLYFADKD